VRDWLGDAASLPIASLTPAKVWAMRDKAASAKGRRFGNYVVQVLRLTLEWGRRRGLCLTNPARAVKTLRRPANAPVVNRAWSPDEVRAFMDAAPFQLLVPFALGLFAGMRQGDALSLTWSAYDGRSLAWRAAKNGAQLTAPVTGAFQTILDAARAKRPPAVQIAVNSHGEPWSQSGYRASFFKLLRALKAKGAVGPGLTFHGLRHTVGAFSRDAGESEFSTAAAIGDRSTAMAALYGRDADQGAAQDRILTAVQRRFGSGEETLREQPTENGLENASASNRSRRP
jgi:integrase